MTIYLCDGELVCENCAVDVTDDEAYIGGESDSVQCCSYCHRHLLDDGAELTDIGVESVIESVRQELRRGLRTPRQSAWNGSMVWEHGYYAGLPWLTVTREWSQWVLDNCHRIDRADRRLLEIFLFWSRHYDY